MDFDTKAPCESLVVVPDGAEIPQQADAPVFSLSAQGGTLAAEQAAQPGCEVWVSSLLSGGTLRERLSTAKQRYGDRLWLRIEPFCTDFPLPCPTGNGIALTQEESLSLRAACSVFYSAELCCMYCVRLKNSVPIMHLFDTPQSIREKLLLAAQLGISHVFGEIPPQCLTASLPP